MTVTFRSYLITGASSGIGAALALRVAAPGVRLSLVARRRAELETVAQAARSRGATAEAYSVSVDDTDAMQVLADEVIGTHGVPDVVLANAGVGLEGAVSGQALADMTRVLRVNVIGVVNTLVPFLPAMRQRRRGVVAAVSSVAGFRALPEAAVYSASKAAVSTFMEGLAMELTDTGVRAVNLCPGFVATPMTEGRNHAKPFEIEVAEAAAHVERALHGPSGSVVFPWQYRPISALMQAAPRWLIRWVGAQVRR